MRGKGGSRVTTKLKQGAHIHQPLAWPLPYTCRQPYHAGSGSHGQLFRPFWGSSAWHSRRSMARENPRIKDPACQGKSFKCQLYTTHVGAVGWEPHGRYCLTLLCYIDSRFFLPLEQSHTALLGCRLIASCHCKASP